MSGRIARSLVVAIAVAVMVAGCASGTPRSHSTSSSAPPSPTPSATPITSQPARVPTTCDQVFPAAVLAKVAPGLAPQAFPRTSSLSSWMNERVGALSCSWSNGATGNDSLRFDVVVGPAVTREGFEGVLNGEQGAGIHYPSGVAPDAYTLRVQDKPLGFLFLTPHYGVSGGLYAGLEAEFPSDADTVALEQVYGVVSTLRDPAPLWTPTPNLKGASDCDGLATAEQLTTLGGLPAPRVVKQDGGEYSVSLFDIDRQVGGYWCTWVSDDPSVQSGITVSALPGGAEYAAKARLAGSVDVPGIGDSASAAPDGTLDVVAAGGWVQVGGHGGVTLDQEGALAKQVLANLGYGA